MRIHGPLVRLSLLVSLLACFACQEGKVTLLVDVKTDLVPGVEFTGVQVARLEDVPGQDGQARVLALQEAPAAAGDDYLVGQRAAEFPDLRRGRHVLRVGLLDDSGVVLDRIAIVRLRANSVATIVLTRNCRGVMCPTPTDSPEAIACLGGLCVAADCTPEAPERCPPPACTNASECPAPAAACAQAACVEGTCFAAPRPGACTSGETCVPDVGCVAVDPAPTDGGTAPAMDAGTDGAVDASSDGGPDAATDGGTTPSVARVQRFGGIDFDRGTSVAGDGSGNVFVTGYLQDTVNLGTGPLLETGPQEAFLVSYDSAGATRWARRFAGEGPGGGTASGEGVAVDGLGNVFVTGGFQNSIDLGTGPISSATTGQGDVFVASYDSAGTPRWTQVFGETSVDRGTGIALDTAGNVFVTGFFEGGIDFGSGRLAGAGQGDGFLVSFDSGGTARWARRYGDTGSDSGHGVAVDGAGNVVIAGDFDGTVDIGTGSVTTNGGWDVSVASYGPDGTPRWARGFGSVDHEHAYAVAMDSNGNAIVTGYFVGSVDFGAGVIDSNGSSDTFVLSLDSGGSTRWVRPIGGALSELGRGITTDANDNVIVTGSFDGQTDFGLGALTSAGLQDIFVASYDPQGAARWAMRFGALETDQGTGVASVPGGNVLVTGAFLQTVDFGGTNLTSAGWEDFFVLVLDAP